MTVATIAARQLPASDANGVGVLPRWATMSSPTVSVRLVTSPDGCAA